MDRSLQQIFNEVHYKAAMSQNDRSFVFETFQANNCEIDIPIPRIPSANEMRQSPHFISVGINNGFRVVEAMVLYGCVVHVFETIEKSIRTCVPSVTYRSLFGVTMPCWLYEVLASLSIGYDIQPYRSSKEVIAGTKNLFTTDKDQYLAVHYVKSESQLSEMEFITVIGDHQLAKFIMGNGERSDWYDWRLAHAAKRVPEL